MADRVSKVSYCTLEVSNRAGQGAAVLGALAETGVNLQAFTGFPKGAGKAQIDIVTSDLARTRRAAARNGWRLSRTKRAFLIQGDDRVGAVHRHLQKLADARIRVTAADAVSAGKGRFAMVLWVKPKDYARSARTLGAR